MKTKIGMIAALIVLSASVAMASLYTFNDAGYSYQNQYNWSTSHITDDGNNTGSNSYGGTYPGFQPWFGVIASEEGLVQLSLKLPESSISVQVVHMVKQEAGEFLQVQMGKTRLY